MISDIPHGHINTLQADIFKLFVASFGAAILLISKRLSLKMASLLLFSPLFSNISGELKNGDFLISILDVGQGTAVFVQTEKHVLLYDSGPAFYSGTNAGNLIILPFFRSLGINKLDAMIISHGDNDHIGGAKNILREMQVTKKIGNGLFNIDEFQFEPCISGQSWVWDGVKFEFLAS